MLTSSLILVVVGSVSADVAVVHTGEPGALDAARIASQQLGVKLYEPMIPPGCATNAACEVRPQESHLIVVMGRDPAAGGGVHLELVDTSGMVLHAEDVVAA